MKHHRTLHRELWQWLAENPGAYKADWPGWKIYRHNKKAIETGCWACAQAWRRHQGKADYFCTCCPCDWNNNLGISHCLTWGSPYDLWHRATDQCNLVEASRLALIIRDSWTK